MSMIFIYESGRANASKELESPNPLQYKTIKHGWHQMLMPSLIGGFFYV
jgi:hypothetical protein